jgi:hypothetical protein
VSATVPTGLDLETPDVLGDDAVLCLATNHSEPANHSEPGDVASFSGALCGLWAAGHSAGVDPAAAEDAALQPGANAQQTASPRREAAASPSAAAPAPATVGRDALADLFAGAALGLPGAEKLFGKVRGRLEGYRTIELAGGVGADALALIHAAMDS